MARYAARDITTLVKSADAPDAQGDDGARRTRIAALAQTMYAPPGEAAFSASVLEALVRVGELLCIGIAGLSLYVAMVAPRRGFEWPCLILIPAMAFGVVLVLQSFGLYRLGAFRRFLSGAVRLLAGMIAAFAAAWLIALVLKFDRAAADPFLLAWFGASLAIALAMRLILVVAVDRLSHAGRLTRRTVVVGGGPAVDELLKHIGEQPQADLEILGVFDDRADDRSPPTIGGFRKLGTVDDLLEFSRRTRVDLIIFALPITAEQRILQMLRKLWVLPIDIRLAAHMNKLHFAKHSYSYIGSVPLIDIVERPLADWDLLLKSCFDKIVGGLCLLALSPIMLAVAAAVKLTSKGPILFKQKRYGFNNELIEVYKFRSMYVDKEDATAAKLVTRSDPRVTPVGRFIRKTSLDELPQLFNVVFKGNLSLIGPRPHAVHAKAAERLYDEAVDGYFARHKVRPGLSGWAQIHGWRGETDTQEKIQQRVEHDLYYIENWSILLDLYILLATPFALLKTDNAY
ncbi:MAG TPA: undecaprenyl-phosphate glucose phosphotransferase [Methylovirgula sp.]|jgi:Undecaprenyl-phosphate glucose phosphotransferase